MVLLLLILAWSIGLEASDYQSDNWRENCRSELSGVHLAIYEDWQVAERRLQASETALAEYESAYKKALVDLKKYEQLEIENPHSSHEIEMVEGARHRARVMEFGVKDQKATIIADTNGLKKAKVQYDEFMQLVGPMFVVVKPVGLGWQLKLDYRFPCQNAYRYSCLLPEDQKKLLASIVEELEQLKACRTYLTWE